MAAATASEETLWTIAVSAEGVREVNLWRLARIQLNEFDGGEVLESWLLITTAVEDAEDEEGKGGGLSRIDPVVCALGVLLLLRVNDVLMLAIAACCGG